MPKITQIIILSLVIQLSGLSACFAAPEAGQASAMALERVERLERLKTENPEEYRRQVRALKQGVESRLEKIKRAGPEQVQRFKQHGQHWRERKLGELREKNPKRFERLKEQRVQRLEGFQKKHPERFKEFVDKEPRRKDWLTRQQHKPGMEQGGASAERPHRSQVERVREARKIEMHGRSKYMEIPDEKRAQAHAEQRKRAPQNDDARLNHKRHPVERGPKR